MEYPDAFAVGSLFGFFAGALAVLVFIVWHKEKNAPRPSGRKKTKKRRK